MASNVQPADGGQRGTRKVMLKGAKPLSWTEVTKAALPFCEWPAAPVVHCFQTEGEGAGCWCAVTMPTAAGATALIDALDNHLHPVLGFLTAKRKKTGKNAVAKQPKAPKPPPQAPEEEQQRIIMLEKRDEALEAMTRAEVGARGQLPGVDRLLG